MGLINLLHYVMADRENRYEKGKQIKSWGEVKPGDRVVWAYGCTTDTDGVLQKQGGDWYICQNVYDGSECDHKFGYKYSWKLSYTDNLYHAVPLGIEGVKEGDILAMDSTWNCKTAYCAVIGRAGSAVFTTAFAGDVKRIDMTSSVIRSMGALKAVGYEIYTPEEPEDDKVAVKIGEDTLQFSKESVEALRKWAKDEQE